ncbi:MAG: nucleoside hydrolase [Paracoccus sp. (in: a-proteobacteria)]|jgi:purine nucleosidase|uniref:nucleoside hydrolase n=1 Tax=unclassified Paracoccus (in: a-proteobacteria) TaxID=2688777 RepID=UPI000C35EB9B|nr:MULTISPECIES: nucleoside hydrolase [unclassified Paracoccus (in: a-proteobacteria)]MAN54939.1 nucleoside hydrolase [Paracoccus sp. (in: a-proteobacteria)]MCS5602474.1 nucleoside hydrolase [Paracoccus sp. (in: a-proteobacteria)]|tara:strand:+ start:879 stop:1817 length:939 start_codon:yes stop_codon:yes gene_type:complete
MAEKIIIDTDPGQDDAVAILLALASPELEVLGITTVAGNVPLPLTTLNALKILELAGRADLPVFAGCEAPLRRRLVTAEHVHGKTGLDGIELPVPATAARDRHAVDFIVETLRREPAGSVTLVPIGPLTNIARALERAPDIAARIRRIVIMGGAYFEVGNITPAAEFNIYVDPEAARAVFAAGAPLVILPLDATHEALTSRGWIETMRGMPGRCGPAVASWTDFFERFDRDKYGSEGAPLHDPCTIAWLLRPDLFEGREINVEIETQGEFTTGMTVADWWRVSDRPANALFIRHLDRDALFALITERIARLP